MSLIMMITLYFYVRINPINLLISLSKLFLIHIWKLNLLIKELLDFLYAGIIEILDAYVTNIQNDPDGFK